MYVLLVEDQQKALGAGTHGAGRLKKLADMERPGCVFALGNLEADLDIFSGVIAFAFDALDELTKDAAITSAKVVTL